MRGVLRRVWSLPWPEGVRQLASKVVILPGLRAFFIPHFMVGVVGLIQNQEGEVLLVRHTYRRRHPWGLPTGFLEHREQPIQALHREIREETGFTVRLDPSPAVYTSWDRPLVNIVYVGSYLSGTFSASPETADARFFPFTHLPDLDAAQAALIRQWNKEQG